MPSCINSAAMFLLNPLILDFSVMRLFQRETQTRVLVVATLPPLSTAPVTLCYSHRLGWAADLLISSPRFLSYHPALQSRLTRECSLQCQVWQLAAQGTATVIWQLGTATGICSEERPSQQHDDSTALILCLCGPSPVPKPGDFTARTRNQDQQGNPSPGTGCSC